MAPKENLASDHAPTWMPWTFQKVAPSSAHQSLLKHYCAWESPGGVGVLVKM